MKKLSKEQKQICKRLIALLLICVIGLTGALAFLTATDSKKNVFTVGSVDVVLHEDEWESEDGVNFFHKDGLSENILPGQKIPKAPYIENVGLNDAWVYITVSVPTSEIEDIYEVDGQTAISGEQLDMSVTAYAIQDGYEDKTGYREVGEFYFENKNEELFGTEATTQQAATLVPVFKLLADENSEEMIDSKWEQIGPVYRSFDNEKSYNNYIFAYKEILPANESTNPLFRFVALYENIGDAKPVILTYWINNQELEQSLDTMSFNTFALNRPLTLSENSEPEVEEDLSDYTAVKTEIYNPGEKVTELYFNDELAKAGYSFNWKFSTNSTESAYVGMTIEEDTNLISDYSTILEEENTEEADYLSYLIQYNEKYGGLYALLTGANPNHPNYPSEPTEVVVPTYLYATFDGETINIKNGTFIDYTTFSLSNKDGNYVRGQSYMEKGVEYKIPVKKTYTYTISTGTTYVNNYQRPLVNIAKSVVYPDLMVEVTPLLSGSRDPNYNYDYNTVLENVSFPYGAKTAGGVTACTNLSKVVIPATVEKLFAFDRSGITELEIPLSVTSIADSAFAYCPNLTALNIPSSVTLIGQDAFSNCTSLKNVTMDKSVTYLGRRAFNATSMDNFYYTGTPDDWCNITYDEREGYEYQSHPNYFSANTYFEGVMPQEITLTNGVVTKIPNYAFARNNGNTYLTKINIPDSVQEIGLGAFYKCAKLESIKIPNGCEYIGYRTFMGCVKLAEIDLGNTIKRIDKEAFRDSSAAKVINLPASCTEIGENAFRTCGVSKLILNGDITVNTDSYLGSFYNSSITELVIGKNAINVPDYLITYSGKKTVEAGNPAWRIENNFLYNNDRIMDVVNSSELPSDLTIGSNATFIFKNTFASVYNLQSVTFEEGFKEIDSSVFNDCRNLATLNIPSTVTKIGNNLRIVPPGINLDKFVDLTVNYAGTMAQWNNFKITKGLDKVTVVCTDGTITY